MSNSSSLRVLGAGASSCVAVCCSVLQCVAVRCSALQCIAVRCSVLQCVAVFNIFNMDFEVIGNVKQLVLASFRGGGFLLCCGVLQCVAAYCSVLQLQGPCEC